MRIISPERIQQALGEENHQALLDQYATSGELDQGSMAQLFSATQGLVRYVILGRVENDQISKSTELQEDQESPLRTKYRVRRDMTVSFQVYDIETAPMVFTGSISHEDFDLQIDAKSGAPDDDCSSILSFAACIFDFISWFEDKDVEGFPPPPELDDIVTEIFDQFAETLPAVPSS